MPEKRKSLGRGLESLLHPRLPNPPLTPGSGSAASGDTVLEIPLEHLDANPYQTRTHLDQQALDELCASILAMGVMEPIIVRPAANGRYQIIAGARRVKASSMAEKARIPAIVRQASDQQVMEMTIVENLLREDLNVMDQARAYQRLSREFGLTQDEMANRTGKERSTVSNFLRLLKLPEMVQNLLEKDELSFGHAKALLALDPNSPQVIIEAAQRARKFGLTVRQLEEFVDSYGQPRKKKLTSRTVDPNVRAAEQQLERALGVHVAIADRNGSGRIVLEYKSLEDFDRIIEAVTGE
jgi:ParB family transcriptional regulator, chromosome partitioning protein